jgi:hypothetical protein
LANEPVVALTGGTVPVQFVFGALLDADGGPGFIGFFNIVAHVYSCLRQFEFDRARKRLYPPNISRVLPERWGITGACVALIQVICS